jgi:hypothetical protein
MEFAAMQFSPLRIGFTEWEVTASVSVASRRPIGLEVVAQNWNL